LQVSYYAFKIHENKTPKNQLIQRKRSLKVIQLKKNTPEKPGYFLNTTKYNQTKAAKTIL